LDQFKTEKILSEINSEDGRAEKIINLCQKQEFITNIYGDEDFQIFPYLKVTLKKSSFFGDDERFILFNLSDFLCSYNENKKKLYRVIFEQNIDERKIDQEQHILKEFDDRTEFRSQSFAESEEIILKHEDVMETPDGEDDLLEFRLYKDMKKDQKDKNDPTEFLDEEALSHHKSIEQIEYLMNYKNMEISETFLVNCSHKDKINERFMKKKLRCRLKKRLISLKVKEVYLIVKIG
jgi:hypothetical protein